MQTYATKISHIERDWYVLDATDKVLGRVASEVAQRLMGKHKPYYVPHLDTGDFVIIVNAEKIKVTGKKPEQKFYFRHSGYPGGARQTRMDKLMREKPGKVIQLAVKGMLPHNRLGRALLKKLKIYAGPVHPHEAQQPQPLEF